MRSLVPDQVPISEPKLLEASAFRAGVDGKDRHQQPILCGKRMSSCIRKSGIAFRRLIRSVAAEAIWSGEANGKERVLRTKRTKPNQTRAARCVAPALLAKTSNGPWEPGTCVKIQVFAYLPSWPSIFKSPPLPLDVTLVQSGPEKRFHTTFGLK